MEHPRPLSPVGVSAGILYDRTGGEPIHDPELDGIDGYNTSLQQRALPLEKAALTHYLGDSLSCRRHIVVFPDHDHEPSRL